ncbi:MAG: tripartite tricarboxylate transporter substrate binding protein [Betaproteobacteria bacterium]|nr:tripartite tricarboxylate transporter substrate binding protein [Betaproteobacteria bacterium]
MRKALLCIGFTVLGLAVSGPLAAQSYPSRPVRIVVPTNVGSGPDLIARILGAKLTERWNQQVVIENKPGASTMLGTAEVARSPGDGYSMVIVPDAYSSNPSLLKPFPFDPIKDMAPVAQVAIGGMILVVHPSQPARTVAELVALARGNPGKLNYGTAGPGTTHHMMMELFMNVAGIQMVHIPYSKGPGPMLVDLLEGRLAAAFIASNAALVHVPAGKLRALGAAGPKRLSYAQNIPTVAESGYKGFDIELWYGLLASGATPPDLVQKIYTDVAAVLALADVRERLLKQGIEAAPLAPGPFGAMIREDIARRAKLVKEVGIKAN